MDSHVFNLSYFNYTKSLYSFLLWYILITWSQVLCKRERPFVKPGKIYYNFQFYTKYLLYAYNGLCCDAMKGTINFAKIHLRIGFRYGKCTRIFTDALLSLELLLKYLSFTFSFYHDFAKKMDTSKEREFKELEEENIICCAQFIFESWLWNTFLHMHQKYLF